MQMLLELEIMKSDETVGTITEILDLFYKRIDNISIHTKYTAKMVNMVMN